MDAGLTEILKSPMLVGFAVGMAMNKLHDLFVAMDKTDLASKYGSQLHVVTAVLTFLTSASALAASGHLSQLDLTQVTNLLNFYIPMFVGSQAASPNNSAKIKS
jgi:hypothetical protein